MSLNSVRAITTATLAVASFLGLAVHGSAQSPLAAGAGKSPEDWTIEERLEARFEPAAMKARREVHARDLADLFGNVPDDSAECFIDGSTNPELFLPWEPFTYLLTNAFSSSPERNQSFRASVGAEAEALGIGTRVWPTLEAIVPEILHVRALAKENGQKLRVASGPARRSFLEEDEALGRRACALRHDALQAARVALGEKIFDRFLYRAVAPKMTTSMRANEWREQLRFVEEGRL
jgi:hypothetical protein